MTHIFNLLIISVLWIGVIEELSFADEIGIYLTKITRSKLPLKIPKPFSCSTCMTWWTGLLYLLIINQLTFVNILFLILISASTDLIHHLFSTIKGFFHRMLDAIDNYFGLNQ